MIFIISMLIAILSFSCSGGSKVESDKIETLRIATVEDPLTLDPRLSRDLAGGTVMRMLYEGLMRADTEGQIIPAVAESVQVSDNGLTYTFKLKQTFWTDGTELTASDFEETWKSTLNPSFPAPNAYQLYVIKGAQAAKEGKGSLDTIGVKAVDPHTLVVDLERPAPHFLELVSCPFYFPVAKESRRSGNTSEDHCIGNGPFKLHAWKKRNEFTVEKNPAYWDEAKVSLPSITLYTLDEHTAFVLYKAHGMDWVGSPLSTMPQDVVESLNLVGRLEIAQGAGTHWFRVNTTKAPFESAKMRRAFALAIDRKAIVEHITQGNQKAAVGIVPPSFNWIPPDTLPDNSLPEAQKLFSEALEADHQMKDNIKQITLSYAAGDRNHKVAQAVQQQWNKAFGINVSLESVEAQVLRNRMSGGNYQLALGSWYADYRDPINFLEIFKSRQNATNQTQWENEKYAKLIELSSTERDPIAREHLMASAEELLLEEMPVIPLFHSAYNYLKTPGIEGVYFSPLGFLDFKEARFKDVGSAGY